MTLRILEISAPDSASSVIHKLAEENDAIDWWYSAKNKDKRRTTRILIQVEDQQKLMDNLQKSMHREENWRLVVTPVEAVLPPVDKSENEDEKEKRSLKEILSKGTVSREELYIQIAKGAVLDMNFILLVLLSTIVATIGLLENSPAIVIGAMVIAPFLGPNLALSFASALGDKELIWHSIRTNVAGLALTLVITIILGLFFHTETLQNNEISSRTFASYGAVILALASGAAAVLSMTTGVSSALVGVMVAVALLPPAATAGLLLGAGEWNGASGAFLLLLTNIVCIGLSSQIIFFIKGIKPRTWYKQKKSKQSMRLNLIVWASLLLALLIIITIRYIYVHG